MLGKILAAAALGAVLGTGACTPPPGPVLDKKFGDGTWGAGSKVWPGTYRTANTGPHEGRAQCEWTVSKESNSGTVTLRSHDPGEKVQSVYLADGDVITTRLCGTWGWVTSKNLT